MSPDAPSARSFQQSLNDRVKSLARERGVPEQELHRQFLLQRLLARVFGSDSGAWVLKRRCWAVGPASSCSPQPGHRSEPSGSRPGRRTGGRDA